MISGLFNDLKRKVDDALKIAVAGAISSAAGTAAFACFAVAIFLWTQQNYGTLEAWTALGALFAVVAAAGLAVALVVRSRGARVRRERARETSALARLLQEPAVLLAGLQIVRGLRARSVLPLLILAAIAGGVMTNRNGRSEHGAHHEHAEYEPGEGPA
ncbi:MAG TPA: hypothetical protein VH765_06195 [Xanthobacteraceae bacterium]